MLAENTGSDTIPADVMDALAACQRAIGQEVEGRQLAMNWLIYHGRAAAARWLVRHPADYPRILDALPWWPVAQGQAT